MALKTPTVAELEAAIAAVNTQMDRARSDAEFDRLRPRLENLDYQLGLARRRRPQARS